MTSFSFDQPPPIPAHAPAPIAPAAAAASAVRKPLPRGIVAWGVLAALALGYLTLAATRPDMIAAYFPLSLKPGAAEPNQGQRATTAETEDLGRIRDTLSQLQTDIGQLKSDVAETSSQNKELSARLSALAEQSSKMASATAPSTGAITATPAAQAGTSVAAAAPPASQLPPPELRLAPAPVNGPVASKPVSPPALTISTTEAIAAVAAAAPKTAAPVAKTAEKAADVKLINAPLAPAVAAAAGAAPAALAPAPAKALETGSVKAAAPAPAPAAPVTAAAVKPPVKPVGLQIASAPSLDALRLSWSLLSETHSDSLKNLEPRYSTGVDANGLTYNLMAGPVKSAADAKKMCKELTAKAIACKVIGEFGGEAL